MRRVLLVDDARLLAELEGTPLGRSSCERRLLRPEQDAVELARSFQPELILLRDGESCPDAVDACRRLKDEADTATIPLLFIGVGLDRDRVDRLGADLFLPRPVRRAELREALRRLLPALDRSAERRAVDLGVVLELGRRRVEARCYDLSLSGAFVVAEAALETGERGEVGFVDPERELRLSFEVVREGAGREKQDGHGLRFVGLDALTRGMLARFVRWAGERRNQQRGEVGLGESA